MMSTFNMLIYGPKRTSKCHKTLSCNLFGVMQQFDSTISMKLGQRVTAVNYIMGVNCSIDKLVPRSTSLLAMFVEHSGEWIHS